MTAWTGPSAQRISSGAPYQTVPRVLVFARRTDGHVLLIKGAPDKKIWAEKYNGLGGHVEFNEDPLTAARRELREESGIDLPTSAFRLAAVITIALSAEGPGVLLFVFSAEVAGEDSIHGTAEGVPEWHKPEGVTQLPAVEDLPWLLSIVFSRVTGPVFARYSYTDAKVLQIHEVPDDIG